MLAVTVLPTLTATALGSVIYTVTVCTCITHPATLGPKDKEIDIEKGSTLELTKDEKTTSQEYFV